MTTEQLTQLITFSLAAMKTGSQIAAAATAEIQRDARNPQLKVALDQGAETAKRWAARINRALTEMGGVAAPVNHVLTAHYEVEQRIRQFSAGDDHVRDLNIIASGQRALHYWISFFDTLRTYAAQAGLHQTEQEMQVSSDEARHADEHHTQLARQILGT